MKTFHTKAKYTKWLSADDMHAASKSWLSELFFYKEEQLFLEDLITSYTLQMIDENHFQKSKIIVDELTKIVKETEVLIEAVQLHEKELAVMVDDIDEIELEKSYKKAHRNLTELTSEFKKRYRSLKLKLFELLALIMKQSKQKRLLS